MRGAMERNCYLCLAPRPHGIGPGVEVHITNAANQKRRRWFCLDCWMKAVSQSTSWWRGEGQDE